ncbi:glycosyltransferase family 1 protein [Euzebyella marina]|uniref:Glycosyltransferase family 1 protein n=1 Tax=Euzebyella marina TaxID=1761453 RepID=A0A3G2L860_9FLAO|nr:glycosyltransferase family 1 protein [Euzebyella marina]AYN68440.1 glycosyltransferase family 1 protein [Euzebyella marina]
MRILFIISVLKQGKGGHYHSLHHISREIGKYEDIGIVTLGTQKSAILEKNDYMREHIFFNGTNYFNLYKSIKLLKSEFQPTVWHFFDSNAYNVFKPFVSSVKYKLVVNLCGGPNPSGFPKVENLILFSKENQQWFNKNLKFKKTKITVVPNRVLPIITKKDSELEKENDSFTFMRIARISNFHLTSIKQTLSLFFQLKDNHADKIKLIILGTIQDREAYFEVKKIIGDDKSISLITEDKYTREASKFLYLADAVVATGRGVMEAASLGLPILTPASNSDLPILIDASNFERFFATNFSERNIAEERDIENNKSKLKELLNKSEYYESISKFSIDIFKKNFDAREGAKKYLEFYNDCLVNNFQVSTTEDLYLKFRSYYHFYLSYKDLISKSEKKGSLLKKQDSWKF